jgi:hydroxymethylpyrimidine/phosphomethylpyrimidine kinase
MVASQLEAVLDSVRVDAVKLACPDDPQTLDAIAKTLARHDVQTLVLDPAGAPFDDAALAVLRARLLPLALVAVPNVIEAQSLTSMVIDSWEDMREAARAIAAMGPANVVIKGGKREGGRVTDLLFDGADYRDLTAERVQLDVPGAGTTFDAALAAMLARGEPVQHAAAAAKAYVTKALQGAYDLGGAPALHAFYRYWQPNAPG